MILVRSFLLQNTLQRARYGLLIRNKDEGSLDMIERSTFMFSCRNKATQLSCLAGVDRGWAVSLVQLIYFCPESVLLMVLEDLISVYQLFLLCSVQYVWWMSDVMMMYVQPPLVFYRIIIAIM